MYLHTSSCIIHQFWLISYNIYIYNTYNTYNIVLIYTYMFVGSPQRIIWNHHLLPLGSAQFRQRRAVLLGKEAREPTQKTVEPEAIGIPRWVVGRFRGVGWREFTQIELIETSDNSEDLPKTWGSTNKKPCAMLKATTSTTIRMVTFLGLLVVSIHTAFKQFFSGPVAIWSSIECTQVQFTQVLM